MVCYLEGGTWTWEGNERKELLLQKKFRFNKYFPETLVQTRLSFILFFHDVNVPSTNLREEF